MLWPQLLNPGFPWATKALRVPRSFNRFGNQLFFDSRINYPFTHPPVYMKLSPSFIPTIFPAPPPPNLLVHIHRLILLIEFHVRLQIGISYGLKMGSVVE
jgi:hypothetical protein